MREQLIKLGFSVHEADIYLTLLEIGQTGAGEIIKRTGLHRNIVYDTLDKLIDQKLAFRVVKKKIARFEAADPKRILQKIESNLTLASEIVPELKKQSKNKQEVIIYDGLEGFRTYSLNSLDQIEKGGTLYVLGSIGDLWYKLMGSEYERYRRRWLKKKIVWKMIAYQKSEADLKLVRENNLCQVRIIEQKVNTPANMNIFGDKVALQTFVEPYSVVEIKNLALSEAYLNYFKALWEQGVELK